MISQFGLSLNICLDGNKIAPKSPTMNTKKLAFYFFFLQMEQKWRSKNFSRR